MRPRGVFDLPAREARVGELDALTQAAGFWDDQRAAQKVLRENCKKARVHALQEIATS